MPIHFAGSRRPSASPLTRCLARPAWVAAQNDNGGVGGNVAQVDTPLLRAALEHFAVHGLGAANAAIDLADSARATGDAAGQHHWTAVCRMLDRRLAERRSR